jgi:hypothetical protein
MGSGRQGIESGLWIEHVRTGLDRIRIGTACAGNSGLRKNRVGVGLREFRFGTHARIYILLILT